MTEHVKHIDADSANASGAGTGTAPDGTGGATGARPIGMAAPIAGTATAVTVTTLAMEPSDGLAAAGPGVAVTQEPSAGIRAGRQPAARGQAFTPSGWGKLWASLGFGAVMFVIYLAAQVAGSFHMIAFGVEMNPVMAGCELLAGGMGILFVAALGGKAIARPRTAGMGEAWKAALWLFLVDGALVAIEIAQLATGVETIDVAPDWPVRMMVLVLLCLGVGLFEETLMRGLCLNGLLARLGRTRGGVYGAVILSSLLFGFLHFNFLIDFGDPLQVAQNFMKVLQTGMVGYLLAAILVKTRNLWTVIVIHAANDFMLMFLTYGLTNEGLSTEYVSAGAEGAAVLMVYIVLCLLYIPLVVIGTRMVNRAGAWRGDFYHYDDQEGIRDGRGV